ncbi:MAG: 50S ribosomal protein L11 methyltransferase [Bacillota bacterium]|nr:50S ribosomal protein L11 methyltransferase [Bacillota bacterium]
MRWLEITVRSPEAYAEAMSSFFFDTGSGVVWDDSASVSHGVVTVKGYLPDEEASRPKLETLRRAVTGLLGPDALAVGTLADEDWATAWRAGYHTFRVGKRLVIKPTWETYPVRPGDLVIEMDPGLAFGCGTHPTTATCLEMLERYLTLGAVVYDVGTGSGILAIAAAKLGAGEIRAVDEDPIAVRVARENVERNGAAGQVHVREGDLLNGLPGPADLIVANIVAEVIGPLAPRAAERLSAEGRFIAGGITAAKADGVIAAFSRAGLAVVARRAVGEWVTLVGEKQG